MQRKPGMNALHIHRYDVAHHGFKTLQLHNFVRTDQNNSKLCSRLFSHKIIKTCYKTGVSFWPEVPFKMIKNKF